MIQHYTHNTTLYMLADGTLTHACDPISSVSLVTGTGEATRSVGTGSISAAVVITRRSTLIKIYSMGW